MCALRASVSASLPWCCPPKQWAALDSFKNPTSLYYPAFSAHTESSAPEEETGPWEEAARRVFCSDRGISPRAALTCDSAASCLGGCRVEQERQEASSSPSSLQPLTHSFIQQDFVKLQAHTQILPAIRELSASGREVFI